MADTLMIIYEGTLIIFCGNKEIVENIIPLNPNSSTKKPTVKPIVKALTKIRSIIKGIPIIVKPKTQIINMNFVLFIIECFKTILLLIVLISTFWKKRLMYSTRLSFCCVFSALIEILLILYLLEEL